MNDLGYVNMGTNAKFKKFIAINYEPSIERPAFDVESEFIVQMILSDGVIAWYGPIAFDDLNAFVNALPDEERTVFIHRVKGGQNG